MESGLIAFVGFYVLGGFLLVAIVSTHTRNEIDAKLAADMLKGTIQHEAKALLKALQSKAKIDAPLKFLCNSVCYFKRLGGTFDALNEKIATISTTLASQQHPTPRVVFSYNPDADHSALVEIGNSGRKYIFDLHRADSLDVLVLGLGLA
jgi:hypothetical protein